MPKKPHHIGNPSPAVRSGFALILTVLLLGSAWLSGQPTQSSIEQSWTELRPGLFQSRGATTGYAIIHDGHAVLIGAAEGMQIAELKARGVREIDLCLLTHHHRDSIAEVQEFMAAGIPVRASKASAEWLTTEGVRQFWQTSLPVVPPDRQPGLRDRSLGLFSYLVHPTGFDRIDCTLQDGQQLQLGPWQITCLATPGHSRDHMSFAARNGSEAPAILFCGDAFYSAGKMWTPYTLDWDHWTDTGFQAAAASLRKLAEQKPALICPEHGALLAGPEAIAAAIDATIKCVEEAGFLKSYERFTKDRLKNPPKPEFLAREQVATAGEKPWTKLTPHLYLSGNTYVLSSRDGGLLIVDPFGPQIAAQISHLQNTEKLGPVEVILVTHAHNDHYTGAFLLPERQRWQVWTLDAVARPISAPFSVCAPYVDTRALDVDRILKHGEVANWHEYSFRVGHFPGQTMFTMGLETTIDQKKCYFTGDNFFHADQFSGSGGWSGRNRAWPRLYGQSARQVLDATPDWILAEHGGAFVFSPDDFQRRIQWCEATAAALDALSPSNQHRHDWNPTQVTFEPMLIRVGPDQMAQTQLTAENQLDQAITLQIRLLDQGRIDPFRITVTLEPHETLRRDIQLKLPQPLPAGRHFFPFMIREQRGMIQEQRGMLQEKTSDVTRAAPADAFVVLESGSSTNP